MCACYLCKLVEIIGEEGVGFEIIRVESCRFFQVWERFVGTVLQAQDTAEEQIGAEVVGIEFEHGV